MLRMCALLTSMVIVLSACAEEETVTPTDSQNSFVIHRGIYNNAVFKSLTTASSKSAVARAATGKGEIQMFGLTSRSAENFTMSMLISQPATGSYSVGKDGDGVFNNDMFLTIKSISGLDLGTFLATSGAISVTRWDSIGGMAQGAFSGTFVDETTKDTIEIYNGVFNVPRIAE